MPYVNPYIDGVFLGLLLAEYVETTLTRVLVPSINPKDYSTSFKRAHMYVRYRQEIPVLVFPKSGRPYKPEAVDNLQTRLLLDYKDGRQPTRDKRVDILAHRLFPKNNAKRAWLRTVLTQVATPEWCKPFTQDYGDYLAHLYRKLYGSSSAVAERLKRFAGLQNFYSADPLSIRVADCEEMLASWMDDIPRYAKALLALDYIVTRRCVDDIFDIHLIMTTLTRDGLKKTENNATRAKRRKRNRHAQKEL